MRRSSTLADDLATHRREAIEQLLALTEEHHPPLYGAIARLSDALVAKTMTPGEGFREAGAVYARLVDALLEQAKERVVEGRWSEAVSEVRTLVKLVHTNDFENELHGLRGAIHDLLRDERQGKVGGDDARARLRDRIFKTFDAIRDVILADLQAVTMATAGDHDGLSGFSGDAPPASAAEKAEATAPASSPPERTAEQDDIDEETDQDDQDDAILTCTGIRKRYRGSKADVLIDVTIQVRPGRILGIVGLNGAGKTTLLRILAGDLEANGGERRTSLRRSHIAFVPQRPEAWTGTLEQHLTLHAAYHGFTGDENEHEVEKTLRILSLQTRRTYRFHELSAGYQMRCALAQALVAEPLLLLLDEPLAPLDIVAQYRFLHRLHLQATHTRRRLPIVVSSQHIDLIEEAADDLLVLRNGRTAFYGQRSRVGEEQVGTIILLRSTAPASTIRQAVRQLASQDSVFRITPRAPQLHVLRFDHRISAEKVQSALLARCVPHSMLMDVTRSTMAMVLEEEASP